MTFFFIELKMVSGLREKKHLQNFNEGEFVDNPGANDFHVIEKPTLFSYVNWVLQKIELTKYTI